jgi:hypothetical protein
MLLDMNTNDLYCIITSSNGHKYIDIFFLHLQVLILIQSQKYSLCDSSTIVLLNLVAAIDKSFFELLIKY